MRKGVRRKSQEQNQTQELEKTESRNGNLNRPQKGDVTKVEPIRNEKDIRLIKKLLADNPRDFAIFTLGINTNLRASDLLRLTIGQVQHVKPGEQFSLREKKTQKVRSITMNKTVYEAVQKLLKSLGTSDLNKYLFQSRKHANGGMLTVGYLNRLVKAWCAEINIKGNFGSHSLRKTFGHSHRTRFGTDIPTLMVMFNHVTQRQTLDYLGIQGTEIRDAYLREI